MFFRPFPTRLIVVAASALLLCAAAHAGLARGWRAPAMATDVPYGPVVPGNSANSRWPDHLAAMTPEQRQQMRRQMRDHWQQIPAEQRRFQREGGQPRRDSWQPLPPEERRQWREQRQEWQQFRDQRQRPQWQPYRDQQPQWREERPHRGEGRGGRWR